MSSSQRATTSSRPRRNDAPMIGAVSAIVIEPRSQREEIPRQVSAVDGRDVRRRQRSEGLGVVPVVEMPPIARHAQQRIEGRLEAIQNGREAQIPEVVRRQRRQQLQTDVGGRGPVGDRMRAIFLVVVGHEMVVGGNDHLLEKEPDAAGDLPKRQAVAAAERQAAVRQRLPGRRCGWRSGRRNFEKSQVVLARRDTREKSFVPMEGLAEGGVQDLRVIQEALFARAVAYRDEHTSHPIRPDEFKATMEGRPGFVVSPWCEDQRRAKPRSRTKRRPRFGTSRSAAHRQQASGASSAARPPPITPGSPRRPELPGPCVCRQGVVELAPLAPQLLHACVTAGQPARRP